MVSESARERSNQRKGGYHERKQGKRLGELTGFTFERKLGKRREADQLGDLLCSNARWPFVIRTNIAPKVTASRQGRGSKPAERHLNRVSGPSVIWQNGSTAPRCCVPLSAIGCAQGGYKLIPFGTADLSLEDYADLAMRLMGISKTHR